MNGEDSLRNEQLDYFEQVLENSMATSEERLEQSNATNANSNRIHSSSERLDSSITHKRISTSLEMQSTSNAVITQNVMVKCSRRHKYSSQFNATHFDYPLFSRTD